MKRIIHFNHNVKNNLNIGDQAHVKAIQETLARLYDDELEFVERPIQLLSQHTIPSKPYYPKSKLYPTFIQNFYGILSGESASKLIEECNKADLVLIGGGGVYMSYLFPLNDKLIESITTPIVLFGVGYNHNLGAPEFSERQLNSVHTLAHKARIQAVRDKVTHDFLKRHGIESAIMCDPAIFLSEIDQQDDMDGGTLKIAINMARHGWNNQAALQDRIVDAYAELIQNIKKQQPSRFYYFVHQPNELKYVDLLQKKGITFDGIVNASARETKSAYRRVDVSVSMMLHSSILAFGAGYQRFALATTRRI